MEKIPELITFLFLLGSSVNTQVSPSTLNSPVVPRIQNIQIEETNIPPAKGFTYSKDESDTVNKLTKDIIDNLNTLPLPRKFDNASGEGFIWWVTDDNFNIAIENPSFGETFLRLDERSKLQYDIQPVIEKTNSLMASHGFIVNNKSSYGSAHWDDNKYEDNILAYENKKKRIICALKLNNDGIFDNNTNTILHKNLSFSCSGRLQKFYAEQVPFLKGIKEKGGIVSKPYKKSKDYVVVGVHGRRAGHYVILKKTAQGYKFIYAGQDIPPCDIVRINKIPREISSACNNGGKAVNL